MRRSRTLILLLGIGISLLLVLSLGLGPSGLAGLAGLASTPTASPMGTSSPSPTETRTAAPTNTPGPCDPLNIPSQVSPMHALMREFEDTSIVAQNTPIESVPPLVTDLQRIRRAAEDLETPSCLAALREHELAHMNTVIDTFLAFLSRQGPDVINPLITEARAYHESYMRELSALMGWTPVPSETSGGTRSPGIIVTLGP